ncbi:sugar phosphate transporter domain-containing protein [Pseudoscourfieldia marina]
MPAVAVARATTLAMWLLLSSAIILSNKELVGAHKFVHPMTLSAMGMAATAALAYTCKLAVYALARAAPKREMKGKPAPEANSVTSMLVVPLGFVSALTLYTGNAAYLYLSVGFVQMLKAFTPVLTMFLLWICELENITPRLAVATVVIAAGTAMAAKAEPRINLQGLAYMLTSMVGEAAKMVLTQSLLTKTNGSKSSSTPKTATGWSYQQANRYLDTLGSSSFVTSAFLGIGAHVYEADGLYRALPNLFLAKPMYTVVKSSLAFFVNLSQLAALSLCGSLVLKVAGCVKSALLVYLGWLLFNEEVSAQGIFGYGVSLVGFYFFTQAKQSAAVPPKAAKVS